MKKSEFQVGGDRSGCANSPSWGHHGVVNQLCLLGLHPFLAVPRADGIQLICSANVFHIKLETELCDLKNASIGRECVSD